MNRHGRVAAALGLAALSLVLSACQGGSGNPASVREEPAAATSSVPSVPSASAAPAEVSVTPADASTDVLPSARVVVTADTGALKTVSVEDADGAALEGSLQANGRWVSSQRLRPSTAYTVQVVAEGPEGARTSETSTFRTLEPAVTAIERPHRSSIESPMSIPPSLTRKP